MPGRRLAAPLFLLAQTDPLRVYVNVPQTYAQLVKPGQPVVVTQAELRGQTFRGQVARTAASIDAAHAHDAGRDRAAQPRRHAAARCLCAGGAAAGRQRLAAACRPTRCCSAARARWWRWSMRKAAWRCASVGVGRNFGENFEVLDGVGEADRVVLNPPTGWPMAERRARRHRVGAQEPRCADRQRTQPWQVIASSGAALAHARRAAAPRIALAARPDYRKPDARAAGDVEGRGAVAREPARRRRAQGPVVAALRRCAARRARSSRRWPTTRRSCWPRRAWRRRAPRSPPPRRRCCRSSASARARRARRSRPTGRCRATRARTSRRCRTTCCSRWRSTTRSTSPAGCSDRSKAPARQLEQSAADLENTRLLLTTDLATNYFNLRALDIELDVLDRAIALLAPRARAGEGAPRPRRRHRPRRGAAAGPARHHARAGRRASSASATSSSMRSPRWPAWQRRTFTLRARHPRLAPPSVPLGVPSDVLERRPDIASAERAMAAANAQIGVATRGVLSERDAVAHAVRRRQPLAVERCSTRRACCGRWACRPRKCCSTTGA